MAFILPPSSTVTGSNDWNWFGNISTTETGFEKHAIGWDFEVLIPCTTSQISIQENSVNSRRASLWRIDGSSFTLLTYCWLPTFTGVLTNWGTGVTGWPSSVTLQPGHTYAVSVDTDSGVTAELIHLCPVKPDPATMYPIVLGLPRVADEDQPGLGFPPTNWSSTTFTITNGYPKIHIPVSYTYTVQPTHWEAPVIKSYPNTFSVQLPSETLPVDLKEWDLQVSKSADDGIYDVWIDVATVPGEQLAYTHGDQDARQVKPFYRYRYKLRNTSLVESDWSDIGYAGAVSSVGTTDITTGGALGPGSVDDTNLADGSVLPRHITTIAGNNFIFPGTVKSNVGGFIFPDGTTQTTAGGGGDKTYVHNQVTPAATWTINHNLGKYPSIQAFDGTGEEVFTNPQFPTTNQVILAFGVSFGGVAYLN